MINSDSCVMSWVRRQDLSEYPKPQKDKCPSLTDLSEYPLNNSNFLIHPGNHHLMKLIKVEDLQMSTQLCLATCGGCEGEPFFPFSIFLFLFFFFFLQRYHYLAI